MTIISSRPLTAAVQAPQIPSTYQHGDIVGFQPGIIAFDPFKPSSTPQLIECRIVRISFDLGKVLYDLELGDGAGNFYDAYPLCNVDSYLVTDWP